MANEIIVGERGNGSFQFFFLYTIPPAKLIEIGGTGTTGKYPVLTPTSNLPEYVLDVLTAAEEDSLNAGEKLCWSESVQVADSMTDAEILALAQDLYTSFGVTALAKYAHRYKYIGRRFDKE